MENFLVDLRDDGEIMIKLADFGMACRYDGDEPPTKKCGSLLSVAPEVLT